MLSRNYVRQSFSKNLIKLPPVLRKLDGKRLQYSHLPNLASVLCLSSRTEMLVETAERKRFGQVANSVVKSYAEPALVVQIQTYAMLVAEDWDSGGYQVLACGDFAKTEKRSQSKVIAMYSDL